MLSKRLILGIGSSLLALAALVTIGFAVAQQQVTVVTLVAENPYDGMILKFEPPYDYTVQKINTPDGVEVSHLKGLINSDSYHPIVLVDVPEGLDSIQIEIEVNKR